jgi:hypothetical protein
MICTRRRTALTIGAAVALSGVLAMPAGAAAPPTTAVVSGTFGTAASSITFPDSLHGKCRLTVTGTITFPGPAESDPNPRIVGTADGVTTALVDAPCPVARANPPGIYADVFHFTGALTGTIDGVPTTGTLIYRGTTEAGGHINADLTIRAGRVHADLSADAFVLRGGQYTGIIRS